MRPLRRSQTRSKHVIRVINKENFGHPIRPPPDPAAFVASPWNSIILVLGLVADSVLSAKDITTSLYKVLGLPANFTPGYRIRIQSVRVWGVKNQPIMLGIYRVNAIGSMFRQQCDIGSPTAFSRVGWQYGQDAQIPLSADDTDALFEVKGSITSAQRALVYVQLLYQSQVINIPDPDAKKLLEYPTLRQAGIISVNDILV